MSLHTLRGVPASVAVPRRRQRRPRHRSLRGLGFVESPTLDTTLDTTLQAVEDFGSDIQRRVERIWYIPGTEEPGLDVTSRITKTAAVKTARSGGGNGATPAEAAQAEAEALAAEPRANEPGGGFTPEPGEAMVVVPRETTYYPATGPSYAMWPPNQWPWWAWVGAGVGALGLLRLLLR